MCVISTIYKYLALYNSNILILKLIQFTFSHNTVKYDVIHSIIMVYVLYPYLLSLYPILQAHLYPSPSSSVRAVRMHMCSQCPLFFTHGL